MSLLFVASLLVPILTGFPVRSVLDDSKSRKSTYDARYIKTGCFHLPTNKYGYSILDICCYRKTIEVYNERFVFL